MRRIRCCVIDDEPLALELIKSYVERTPFLQLVNAFPAASSAIKTIIEEDIDLVFLDIQMSELNGTEFAKVVPPRCKVIFVTAFDKYAVEAFRVGALDYLLKPVNYSEFIESANRAMRWFVLEERASSAQSDGLDSIIVKSEYKLVRVDFDDILYVEGVKDYVKFYFSGNRKPMMTLMNMKTVEDSLPHYQFMRVHRSFIVNMDKINMIDRGRIVIGDVFIPVSEISPLFTDYFL